MVYLVDAVAKVFVCRLQFGNVLSFFVNLINVLQVSKWDQRTAISRLFVFVDDSTDFDNLDIDISHGGTISNPFSHRWIQFSLDRKEISVLLQSLTVLNDWSIWEMARWESGKATVMLLLLKRWRL
jgi:hypothetical protein